MSDDMTLPDLPDVPHEFRISPPPETGKEPSIISLSPPDHPSLPDEISQMGTPAPPPQTRKPPRPAHSPVHPHATPPVCQIAGRVLNRFSLPVSGAEVSLIPKSSSRPEYTATTGKMGAFRFKGVRPGKYRLRAVRHFRKREVSIVVSPQKCCQTGIRIRL